MTTENQNNQPSGMPVTQSQMRPNSEYIENKLGGSIDQLFGNQVQEVVSDASNGNPTSPAQPSEAIPAQQPPEVRSDQEVVAEVVADIEQTVAEADQGREEGFTFFEKSEEEPPAEVAPAEDPKPEGEQQPPAEGEPDDKSPEVNFKRLRQSHNEVKSTLLDRDKEVASLQARVDKYEAGEIVPEALQSMSSRIAQLEPYEKLVALKTSPEYQDKYVKPLQEVTDQLKVIAKDYAIPEETLLAAVDLDNRADINRFLSRHFDDAGIIEVKQLLTKTQDLKSAAESADSEPGSALDTLLAENLQARETRAAKNKEAITTVSRAQWGAALNTAVKDNKAHELIRREGDDEHNKNVVEPLLANANKEYDKIINMLADSGVEKLPSELLYALARMTQLACASATSIETRHAAMQHAENVERGSQRQANYIRPQIGKSSGRASAPAVPQPKSHQTKFEDKIDDHMNEVLSGRG